MGLTGELVKKVFCKIRSSAGGHDENICCFHKSSVPREKVYCLGKNSSSLTKIRFCGDIPKSVLDEEEEEEEEDNVVSADSSEATIPPLEEGIHMSIATTSATETFADSEQTQRSKEALQESSDKQENPQYKQLKEEDATTIIQSAIRGFLERRRIKQLVKIQEKESSTGVSTGTSTEVQAGDSVRSFKLQAENVVPFPHKVHRKSRPHIPHQKEWDDSTLSSNILQQKIQNRLEAMTRREKALAYAFAQQLRTCADKRRSSQCETEGSNVGWSWLERWMATRIPENSSVEDCLGKNSETVFGNRRSTLLRKQFDLALDEESCASNDINVSFENYDAASSPLKNSHISSKDQKNVSRTNNLPGNHHAKQLTKVVKIESLREAEKVKRKKQMRSKISGDDF